MPSGFLRSPRHCKLNDFCCFLARQINDDDDDDEHKRREKCWLWTLPPFATAHTICASQDGSRNSYFLRRVHTKTKVFLCSLSLCEKSRS